MNETTSESDDEIKSLISRVPKNAPILKLEHKATGTIKEMREQAKEYARANFVGSMIHNNELNADIGISMSGVKHTLSGNSDEDLVNSVFITPDILKKGVYIGNEPERKGNKSVLRHHYLAAKIEINGIIHDVVADVREMADGNFYYDHSFERNNASESLPSSNTEQSPASKPEGLSETIPQPTENTIEPEPAQVIDPVEAVQKWINNDADKPPFESLEKEILKLESNGDLNFKINGVLFYATKHNTINSNDRKIVSQGREFNGAFGSEINQWLTSLGKVKIGGSTSYEKVVEKIDPVALENINAANLSDAIKKKAIAYLNENPSSHQLFEKETPAGKKAYVAIMENLKTALFAEVNALNPLFRAYQNYTTMMLRGKDNERLVGFTVKVAENYKMTFGVNDYSGSTANTEIEDYKNIFDSTSTLEELRQWGFTLPFDLDVKAFVANVIKPVVDEFLAKIEAETENVGQNEAVELGDNAPQETELSEIDLETSDETPETLITAPDGSNDFGEITPEQATLMGGSAGKIKLQLGFHDDKTGRGFGKIHIDRDIRAEQLKANGYGSTEDLIFDVAQNKNAIFQGKGNTFILAKNNGKAKIAFVQVKQGDGGIFYSVGSGLISRADYLKNKALLWERAQSNQIDNNPPSAVTGEKQSSNENIAQPPQNATADIDAELAELETPKEQIAEQEAKYADKSTPNNDMKKTTGKIESIDKLIDIARNSGDNKAFVEIGKVSPEVAEKVKEVTGIDVEGFVHSIDEAAIRHIFKQHGNEKTEKSRGQIGVTDEDIKNIKEIVENPDEIQKGDVLADGIETVIYKKTIDGMSIYVQEVRKGRGRLAAKTLWKVPAVPPAASDKSNGLVHTSETSNAHFSQGNENIPQPPENATADIDAELAELETLIGAGDIFDEKMDALIEKIDGLGLMTQFEPKLLQLDRDNSNANAKGI